MKGFWFRLWSPLDFHDLFIRLPIIDFVKCFWFSGLLVFLSLASMLVVEMAGYEACQGEPGDPCLGQTDAWKPLLEKTDRPEVSWKAESWLCRSAASESTSFSLKLFSDLEAAAKLEGERWDTHQQSLCMEENGLIEKTSMPSEE